MEKQNAHVFSRVVVVQGECRRRRKVWEENTFLLWGKTGMNVRQEKNGILGVNPFSFLTTGLIIWHVTKLGYLRMFRDTITTLQVTGEHLVSPSKQGIWASAHNQAGVWAYSSPVLLHQAQTQLFLCGYLGHYRKKNQPRSLLQWGSQSYVWWWRGKSHSYSRTCCGMDCMQRLKGRHPALGKVCQQILEAAWGGEWTTKGRGRGSVSGRGLAGTRGAHRIRRN